jgi:hypothetical protein
MSGFFAVWSRHVWGPHGLETINIVNIEAKKRIQSINSPGLRARLFSSTLKRLVNMEAIGFIILGNTCLISKG